MTRSRYFIEPVDVLFVRGNRLFGDPGSFGESLMPPWPSAAAGAIRSALLAERGYDPAAFARGEVTHDEELGTPGSLGTFTMTAFDVARRDGDGSAEAVYALPADLVVHSVEAETGFEVRRMTPRPGSDGIRSSASTAWLAVLAEPRRGKPVDDRWLNLKGWRAHLSGEALDAGRHLVRVGDLWATDVRVGIRLDPVQRRAADHALFTSEAVTVRKRDRAPAGRASSSAPSSFDVGFLAEMAGVTLPDALTLRFGGDGRAARATRPAGPPAAPDDDGRHGAIADKRRCRLILTTPGLFADGWRPTGVVGDGRDDLRFDLHGVTGRLVCAAVPRAEVVSGFDVARWRPKPAQRVAPTGSVYWLDNLEATPEALGALEDRGLWSDPVENESRRAEGFNRFTFAAWPQ